MADEMLVPVAGAAVRYLDFRTEVPVNALVTAVQVSHAASGSPKACVVIVDTKVDTEHMHPFGFPVVHRGDVIGELELVLPEFGPYFRWTLPGEI
jgi:hypothetical protein